MNLGLSDEQRMFRDVADRFFADRSQVGPPRERSASLWSEMARLGLLSLPFIEGQGRDQVESMLVHRAIGRTLNDSGYLGLITMGAGLIALLGSQAPAGLVSEVAEGRTRLAFAYREQGGPQRSDKLATRAERASGQWRLTGRKFHVLDAETADKVVVSARIGGKAPRIELFLLDPRLPGVTARHSTRYDNGSVTDLDLDAVLLGDEAELHPGQDASGLIGQVMDIADAARVAQAAGTMEAMLDLTLAHLATRRQFGRALREFQVLQHRAADMYAELQLALAMSTYAYLSAMDSDADARRRSVLAAKAQACRSGRFIGQQSIQLHGGMGMSAEHSIGKLFKRLTVLEMDMGTAEENLWMLAAAGGLHAADPDPLPEFDAARQAG